MLRFEQILIADDHPMVAAGFAQLLTGLFPTARIDVTGDVTTLPEIRKAYDLILVDLAMPGGGVIAVRRLREAFRTACVVVWSASDRLDDVRAAMRFGARGYLVKTMDGSELRDALLQIARGDVYMPAGARLAARHQRAEALVVHGARPNRPLTPAQLRVLDMVLAGRTNLEIANALSITEGTTKNHVAAILRAFGVDRRPQLMALMQPRLPVVPPGPDAR